jgi:hypothetical protein
MSSSVSGVFILQEKWSAAEDVTKHQTYSKMEKNLHV